MTDARTYATCLRDVEQQSFADLLAGIAMAPLNTDRLDAEWEAYLARLDLATTYPENRK